MKKIALFILATLLVSACHKYYHFTIDQKQMIEFENKCFKLKLEPLWVMDSKNYLNLELTILKEGEHSVYPYSIDFIMGGKYLNYRLNRRERGGLPIDGIIYKRINFEDSLSLNYETTTFPNYEIPKSTNIIGNSFLVTSTGDSCSFKIKDIQFEFIDS